MATTTVITIVTAPIVTTAVAIVTTKMVSASIATIAMITMVMCAHMVIVMEVFTYIFSTV